RPSLRFLLVSARQVEGLLRPSGFDGRGDRVRPVGMFMSLGTQGLGQRRHRRQLAGELLDVGAIAQGRDGSSDSAATRLARTSPATQTATVGSATAPLARLLLADDEDTISGEVDVADGDP